MVSGDREGKCVCVCVLKMFSAMVSSDHEDECVCVCVLKIYPAMVYGDCEGKNVCVCVEDVSQGCHGQGKSQDFFFQGQGILTFL